MDQPSFSFAGLYAPPDSVSSFTSSALRKGNFPPFAGGLVYRIEDALHGERLLPTHKLPGLALQDIGKMLVTGAMREWQISGRLQLNMLITGYPGSMQSYRIQRGPRFRAV